MKTLKIVSIPLSQLQLGTEQPRKIIKSDKISELAKSIEEKGLLQPILVKKIAEDHYRVIVGERRTRACELLGYKEIPALILNKYLGDQELFEVAMVENIQREDLTPHEEAWAIKKLIEEFGCSKREVAKRIGKSLNFVDGRLKLLELPEAIQERVREGRIELSHAIMLAREIGSDETKEDYEVIFSWLDEIGWNIENVRAIVQHFQSQEGKYVRKRKPKGDLFIAIAVRIRKLNDALDLLTEETLKAKEKESLEELRDVLQDLGKTLKNTVNQVTEIIRLRKE